VNKSAMEVPSWGTRSVILRFSQICPVLSFHFRLTRLLRFPSSRSTQRALCRPFHPNCGRSVRARTDVEIFSLTTEISSSTLLRTVFLEGGILMRSGGPVRRCVSVLSWLLIALIALHSSDLSAQVSNSVASAQTPKISATHHYIGVDNDVINATDDSLTLDLPLQPRAGGGFSLPLGISDKSVTTN
jgi:hypothetical protein